MRPPLHADWLRLADTGSIAAGLGECVAEYSRGAAHQGRAAAALINEEAVLRDGLDICESGDWLGDVGAANCTNQGQQDHSAKKRGDKRPDGEACTGVNTQQAK